MINLILKDLVLWIFGLFLDLMNYCANALLGLMNTDLSYFESNVPIVVKLYGVFVAIGWGFLIGNCAFQCLKAMFAGLGFETESPAILLARTFLFGFLLIMYKQICEIGLSIGKTLMELIGLPENVSITFPDDSMFPDLTSSWLLIVIIGFLIGSQLIKLFFEIGERYALVAILTLFSPVAFAMGGSRSTKDICSGFVRTYASMILLLVSNVLFLKLICSALSSMPDGIMILPWTVLIVGIARVARKADNLLAKIGLNPSFTGDPLGNGTGRAVAFMAARSILNSATHSAVRQGAHASGKEKSEFKANSTGNRTSRSGNAYTRNTASGNCTDGSQAKSRNTANNNNQTNASVIGGSNISRSGNTGVNTAFKSSYGINNSDFGRTAVAGINTNRFGAGKVSGQKGETRLENKGTAIRKNAANSTQNTASVGRKKNKPSTQRLGNNYADGKQFGTQKLRNKAWKPDKSFSHNPAGKRFGQTNTPPNTKPKKAVENEPKQ